jgi:tRNA 2-thiouridine synthesizing protein A
MSRTPWLGRPAGRHAAGARGRGKAAAGGEPAPRPAAPAETAPPAQSPPAPAQASPPAQAFPPAQAPRPYGAGMLGAPVAADTAPAARLVSPVTDAARAAVAESSASLPAYVPAGAAPAMTIDALGRKCPIPIIMLAERIHEIPVGLVVALLADDPAAYSDIPAWCGLKSHDCVFRVDYATGWAFGIRRRY